MRLKPKKLGRELPLDDYNACQHLLYSMDCWNEEITLTSLGYDGIFARYILNDVNNILLIHRNDFLVTGNIDDSHNFFYIDLEEQYDHVPDVYVTLYYSNSLKYDGVTYPPDMGAEFEDSTNETENNITPFKKESITIKAERLTKTRLKIVIPLQKIYENSLVYLEAGIKYSWKNKYFIDVDNGKANSNDEILLDNIQELQRMIRNTPHNNSKCIYRLDSSNDIYQPLSTMTIHEGQYIELRGGTNTNAVIDGSKCGRVFVIEPGGYLVMKNITIQNCNCKNNSLEKGKGGAILVQSQGRYGTTSLFGVLDMNSCKFRNCIATNGGAIYAYNAGVYLTSIEFVGCIASYYGGGVVYNGADEF